MIKAPPPPLMERFTLDRFGTDELTLAIGRYSGGNTAVRIVGAADPSDSYATVSVNVPGESLPAGEFVFKTYSENEGLLEQLLATGVIEQTRHSVRVGFAGLMPVCLLRPAEQE
jgi:hypothetical protein